VRSGLGLALVPEAAADLRFSGVTMRPLKLATAQPVELHMVWRRDNDNPLISSLRALTGMLPPRR
jgi:DNA-binding transcriptional LysR family regulator